MIHTVIQYTIDINTKRERERERERESLAIVITNPYLSRHAR